MPPPIIAIFIERVYREMQSEQEFFKARVQRLSEIPSNKVGWYGKGFLYLIWLGRLFVSFATLARKCITRLRNALQDGIVHPQISQIKQIEECPINEK
jgi:hypothetical protein